MQIGMIKFIFSQLTLQPDKKQQQCLKREKKSHHAAKQLTRIDVTSLCLG